MTSGSPAMRTFIAAARTTLAVSGAVMLLLGVFILLWPAKTAMLFAGIIAAYFVIQGLAYIGAGVFSRSSGGWSRTGHVLLGVVYIIGGLLAFVNLFAFTATLVLFFGIMLGITWIIEGVVALSLLRHSHSRIWTMAYAVLGIVAGIVLLFSPFYVAVFWWLTGVALVALGALQLVRALTLRQDAVAAASDVPADAY